MYINWKKSIFVVCDIAIVAYLLLAVTAFNKPDAVSTLCSEVKIDVEQNIVEGFMTAGEIKRILTQDKCYPLSKPMSEINARQIEESLKKSPFVENAECYKTQSGTVCIYVKQRIPVVRVMADNGENYYVDTHGSMMPESRFVTDQIIATGNISRKYAQTTLTRVANQILQDKFWKNQVVQINILTDGSVEIVPRVGDHVIYLGAPINIDKKLERLRKFYLYGLNKAGWNKYNYINVEFDNQIICKRNKRKK
ncbi:MAG: cell division protein FtsQ [Prevotella sp.]|nr:cell division protein FtsQ [Prevotella sp.]